VAALYLKKVRVCTAYRYNREVYQDFPSSLKAMEHAKPVLEEMEGWDNPLSDATKLSDLPPNARKYIRRLEEILETDVVLVSVGPDRDQTIMLKNPFGP